MELPLIYLICFGLGLVFAIVSAFFAGIFGGHDGHLELPAHADAHVGGHLPGISPLSPTTIATFVTAFGGFGMIFSRIPLTNSPWLSLSLSALAGVLIAACVFLVFNKIFRVTQSSSEGRVAELFGQSAEVITPIRAGGVGQIAYEQGGTRYTASARTDEPCEIATGERVRIVRVAGSQFFVIKD
jgi:membrane protein implicated in regulation of membrane protease activity